VTNINQGYGARGPQWGVMNSAGSWLAIGLNRVSTTSWNAKYSLTESDALTWMWGAFVRQSGWNKWEFDLSRRGTCNITLNDDSAKSIVYNFRWPWDSVTTGFNRLFFKGETSGPETLAVDSVMYTRYYPYEASERKRCILRRSY
jgi:hypothetical protein